MFAVPIVVLAFAATGCEEALKPIAAALQQNQLLRVAGMLNAVRPQCSGSSAFHELAGIASTLSGDFNTGAEELQHAFAMDPRLSNDPAIFLFFVRDLFESNQSSRLTAFLSRQRTMSPPLLFSLGSMFAKHRDYRQAIKYFQKIPAEAADDAVYFNLGLAYSHLRQFEAARKYYFQSIDKNPAHVEAYFRVGLDFAASGDSRKAVAWLLRAREFGPSRPDISYALTEQLLSLQYFDTAGQIAAEALTAGPQDPLLMVASGDVQLAQGKQPEAVASYRSALNQAPKLSAALLGLARVASLQGDAAEARKNLLEAMSIEPENPAVNAELGSIELQAGNWSDAYVHLAKAWSADESNPTVALHLARALRQLNHAADALRLLQALAPALRNSSAFHFELAQIYTRLGRAADAQTEREQAATLQSKSQNTLHFEDPKTYVF